MNANPVLLQKKYARIVELFAEGQKISREKALDFFYHSRLYQLMRDGVSDLHCMSDRYLTEELKAEYFEEEQKELIREKAKKYAAVRRMNQFSSDKRKSNNHVHNFHADAPYRSGRVGVPGVFERSNEAASAENEDHPSEQAEKNIAYAVALAEE